MKKLAMVFFVTLIGLGLMVSNADARRFGGGSSLGKQRPFSQQAAPRSPVQSPAGAPAAPAGGSRWLGPLAGLVAGTAIGSMLFGGGAGGGGMGGIMMIVLLVGGGLVLRRMFSNRRPVPNQRLQYASPAPYGSGFSSTPVPSASGLLVPMDFDVEGFLHHAKVNFVRLQAANDAKDLNDIREFTTPQMYAEIATEIRERDDVAQKTEVVTLNAELMEVTTEAGYQLASVNFSGTISEEINALAQAFDEIWNLQKPTNDKTGWVIAGIQQKS